MKKFSMRIMMLSVVLCVVFAVKTTAYASAKEEKIQSVQLFELLEGEFSEYRADVKKWLSEELGKEENKELVEDIFGFIREKLDAGELETKEEITNAIREGEERFDVSLTEEEQEKVMQFVQKVREMGLDPENLLEQAQNLYRQFGNEMFENPKEVVKKSIGNSVAGFFKDMGNRLKGLFTNIFS